MQRDDFRQQQIVTTVIQHQGQAACLPIDGDLNGYLSGRSTRTFHTPPSYGAAGVRGERRNTGEEEEGYMVRERERERERERKKQAEPTRGRPVHSRHWSNVRTIKLANNTSKLWPRRRSWLHTLTVRSTFFVLLSDVGIAWCTLMFPCFRGLKYPPVRQRHASQTHRLLPRIL